MDAAESRGLAEDAPLSLASGLGWKLRRLRAMSAEEIGWRVRQAVATRAEAFGLGRCRPRTASGRAGRPWVDPLPRPADPIPTLRAADAVLAGRFSLFAMRDAQLGFPPAWNRDPRTGTDVPLRFGKSIDYRNEHQVGDVKYLWELNRHLELVTLAQAWHLGGESRHAQGCRTLLESWFDACPYPYGPNWTSSLEHAYRLVNWSVAWHLLGGDEAPVFAGATGAAFRERWLRSVREHCHFVAGFFSLHSSANNHLLGEYTGLFAGALTWPMWPESARWRRVAREGLEREALLQNAPDGVNREQALHYQRSVIDMMLFAGLLGRANEADFDAAWWTRLERMIDFVAAVTDSAGEAPAFGDADDAELVRWTPSLPGGPNRSRIATGAALFGRADLKTQAGTFDDRSLWWLGDAGRARWETLATPAATPSAQAFPEGGYWLFEHARGTPREVLAVVDCGPLGYPSIAAHGHADALSLVLSAGGHPLLVDPGTFAYHTERAWRDHFRSTAAHNTVCVDGLDQSVSGGNFLWLRKARARCLDAGDDGTVRWFAGEHDGYRRLDDPVIHRRTVRFDRSAARFEIVDEIEAAGSHRLRGTWQWAAGCAVQTIGTTAVGTIGSVRLTIDITGPAVTLQLLEGVTTPPAGWVSRSYDEKTPARVCVWDCSVHGSVRIVTILSLDFAGPG